MYKYNAFSCHIHSFNEIISLKFGGFGLLNYLKHNIHQNV